MATRRKLFSGRLRLMILLLFCIIGQILCSKEVDYEQDSNKSEQKGRSEDVKSILNFVSDSRPLDDSLSKSGPTGSVEESNLSGNPVSDEYIVQDDRTADDDYIVQADDDESHDRNSNETDDTSTPASSDFKPSLTDSGRYEEKKPQSEEQRVLTGKSNIYHYGNSFPEKSGKEAHANLESSKGAKVRSSTDGPDTPMSPKPVAAMSTWEKAELMMKKRNKNKLDKEKKVNEQAEDSCSSIDARNSEECKRSVKNKADISRTLESQRNKDEVNHVGAIEDVKKEPVQSLKDEDEKDDNKQLMFDEEDNVNDGDAGRPLKEGNEDGGESEKSEDGDEEMDFERKAHEIDARESNATSEHPGLDGDDEGRDADRDDDGDGSKDVDIVKGGDDADSDGKAEDEGINDEVSKTSDDSLDDDGKTHEDVDDVTSADDDSIVRKSPDKKVSNEEELEQDDDDDDKKRVEGEPGDDDDDRTGSAAADEDVNKVSEDVISDVDVKDIKVTYNVTDEVESRDIENDVKKSPTIKKDEEENEESRDIKVDVNRKTDDGDEDDGSKKTKGRTSIDLSKDSDIALDESEDDKEEITKTEDVHDDETFDITHSEIETSLKVDDTRGDSDASKSDDDKSEDMDDRAIGAKKSGSTKEDEEEIDSTDKDDMKKDFDDDASDVEADGDDKSKGKDDEASKAKKSVSTKEDEETDSSTEKDDKKKDSDDDAKSNDDGESKDKSDEAIKAKKGVSTKDDDDEETDSSTEKDDDYNKKDSNDDVNDVEADGQHKSKGKDEKDSKAKKSLSTKEVEEETADASPTDKGDDKKKDSDDDAKSTGDGESKDKGDEAIKAKKSVSTKVDEEEETDDSPTEKDDNNDVTENKVDSDDEVEDIDDGESKDKATEAEKSINTKEKESDDSSKKDGGDEKKVDSDDDVKDDEITDNGKNKDEANHDKKIVSTKDKNIDDDSLSEKEEDGEDKDDVSERGRESKASSDKDVVNLKEDKSIVTDSGDVDKDDSEDETTNATKEAADDKIHGVINSKKKPVQVETEVDSGDEETEGADKVIKEVDKDVGIASGTITNTIHDDELTSTSASDDDRVGDASDSNERTKDIDGIRKDVVDERDISLGDDVEKASNATQDDGLTAEDGEDEDSDDTKNAKDVDDIQTSKVAVSDKNVLEVADEATADSDDSGKRLKLSPSGKHKRSSRDETIVDSGGVGSEKSVGADDETSDDDVGRKHRGSFLPVALVDVGGGSIVNNSVSELPDPSTGRDDLGSVGINEDGLGTERIFPTSQFDETDVVEPEEASGGREAINTPEEGSKASVKEESSPVNVPESADPMKDYDLPANLLPMKSGDEKMVKETKDAEIAKGDKRGSEVDGSIKSGDEQLDTASVDVKYDNSIGKGMDSQKPLGEKEPVSEHNVEKNDELKSKTVEEGSFLNDPSNDASSGMDADEVATSGSKGEPQVEDKKGSSEDGKVSDAEDVDKFFKEASFVSEGRKYLTLKPYAVLFKAIIKKLDPIVTGSILMMPGCLQPLFLKAPFNMYPTHAFLLFSFSCLSLFIISLSQFSKYLKGSIAEKKNLRELLSETKQTLLVRMQEKEELAAKLEESREKIKSSHTNMENGMADMNEKLKAIIKESNLLKDETSRHMEGSKKTRSEMKKIEHEISKQTSTNKGLQESLNTTKEVINSLEEKLAELRSSMDEHQMSCLDSEEKFECVQDEINALKTTKAEISADTDVKNKKVEELQKSIEALKEHVVHLSGTLASREEEYKSLRSDIQKLRSFEFMTETSGSAGGDVEGADGEQDEDKDGMMKKMRMEQNFKCMIDMAQLKSRLDGMEEETGSLKKSLGLEMESKLNIDDELKKMREEMKMLEQKREVEEQMAATSSMKIDILSGYYKEKEKEYNRMLVEKEAKEKTLSSQLRSADEKVKMAEKMVAMHENLAEELKKELARVDIDYNNQIATQENKTQENVLVYKQTERDLKWKEMEAKELRQKLLQCRSRVDLLDSLSAAEKSAESLDGSPDARQDSRPASRPAPSSLARDNMMSPADFRHPSVSPIPPFHRFLPPPMNRPPGPFWRHPHQRFMGPPCPPPPPFLMRVREGSPLPERFQDLPPRELPNGADRFPPSRNWSPPPRVAPSPLYRNRSSPPPTGHGQGSRPGLDQVPLMRHDLPREGFSNVENKTSRDSYGGGRGDTSRL